MIHRVHLAYNNGFRWEKYGNLNLKGYIHDKDSLLKSLDGSAPDQIAKQLAIQSGNFAIVLSGGNSLLAAVDQVRSIPLFYTVIQGEVIVSDNAGYLKQYIKDQEFDHDAETEYLLTGYTTVSSTLYPEIKQLQAGQILIFRNNKLEIIDYFNFGYKSDKSSDKEALLAEMDNVHLSIFQKLINSLGGRTAVIPLSGGYDSRLIVEMLSRLDYKNVICFSYGRKINREVQISRQVAEKAGYKWLFIHYTRRKWYKWFNSVPAKEYMNYAGNYSSVAHYQDWAAVMELKNNDMVPADGIFIPGHGGDFLQGSHIPTQLLRAKSDVSRFDIISCIFNKHYSLWKVRDDAVESMRKKISSSIPAGSAFTKTKATEITENWNLKERQAKYIINSVRVYEFFNYEWRLPLLDIELINYWRSVPPGLRLNRDIYIKYHDSYLDSHNIPANPERRMPEKVYEYFFDPWYGRINGNRCFVRALMQKTENVFPCVKDYCNTSTFLYLEQKAGINTITSLSRIKQGAFEFPVAE